jgi:cytochrome P450
MTDVVTEVPSHIPAHLVWEPHIDEFALEGADPFQGVARLHDGPDIIWSRQGTRNKPAWILTRHADIQSAFMDPARFSSGVNSDAADLLGVDWRLNPLEIDPPAHRLYRNLLQKWFQPSAINALEPRMREIARMLIARFENRSGCEFIEEFASQFPSYIFLAIMGMPNERLGEFLRWEGLYMRGADVSIRVDAIRNIMKFLELFIEARRGDPRDDLVSAILGAEIDGRPLNHGEVMGMCMVLYLGGLDTVLSSLGWYMRHLAIDQPLQARLRDDPALIPDAANELLRAFGVTATRRAVTEDLEFQGVVMRAGDSVMLPTYLAGRDPREYSNPHAIDIDRPERRHVTLATGVHNCLGSHLARREIKIVLEEMLGRFRNIRIPKDARVSWHTKGVWGVNHLPLEWDVAG